MGRRSVASEDHYLLIGLRSHQSLHASVIKAGGNQQPIDGQITTYITFKGKLKSFRLCTIFILRPRLGKLISGTAMICSPNFWRIEFIVLQFHTMR